MDRRLGSVSEARDILNLDSIAEVWDRVAEGSLYAERAYVGDPWIIWQRGEGR